MDVVIPYYHKKAVWHELKYALRSWDENFNHDFRVYVVGPEKPDWLIDDVFVEIPVDSAASVTANLGRVMAWACERLEDFLWTNDDILLLKPSCLMEVLKPLYVQNDLRKLKLSTHQRAINRRLVQAHSEYLETGKMPRKPIYGVPNVVWHMLLAGTAQKLIDTGFTAFNAETHTPYYYESRKVERLDKIFPVFSGEYLTRTAYFNVFEEYPVFSVVRSRERFGVYDPNYPFNPNAWSAARYLNYNDRGLTVAMRKRIEKRFPEPSRFEVGG